MPFCVLMGILMGILMGGHPREIVDNVSAHAIPNRLMRVSSRIERLAATAWSACGARLASHDGLVAKLRLKPPSHGTRGGNGESSLLGSRSAAATKTASKARTCLIRKDIGFRRCLGALAWCLLATFAAAPVIRPADLARLAFPPFSSSSDLVLGDVPSTFHAGSRPASVADNNAIQDDAPPIGVAESGRPPVLEPLGTLVARQHIARGCAESCRRSPRGPPARS